VRPLPRIFENFQTTDEGNTMMNKSMTLLAVAAGLSLGSQAVMAQTAPVAPMPAERIAAEGKLPETCVKLQRAGFRINHHTITRSGTAASMVQTNPHPGSFAAPRKYGEGGNDKWFIDSFSAHPKEAGCRVCGVTVAIKGEVSKQSQNNDSITLIGSNKATPQITGSPLAFNTEHTRLTFTPAGGPLPVGMFSNIYTIEGATWTNWYMNSLVPSFDVAAQDEHHDQCGRGHLLLVLTVSRLLPRTERHGAAPRGAVFVCLAVKGRACARNSALTRCRAPST